MSRIYKELLKTNKKKANDPVKKKWAKHLYRHFTKEEIQMANKYMKKCWTSLVLSNVKNSTTIIYY